MDKPEIDTDRIDDAVLALLYLTLHEEDRLMREIRRRTRVVGAFPDGESCLNLAAARLRHIASTDWSTKRYLNMQLLSEANTQHGMVA